MENALLRAFMNKDFYDDIGGNRTPEDLFTDDGKIIKRVIDEAMIQYSRSVTPDEIEAIFLSQNPLMTTARKTAYQSLFTELRNTDPLGADVAGNVMSTLYRRAIGERVANVGFSFVEGKGSLADLQDILERHGDDFVPKANIVWEDTSFEAILAANDMETRWTFNIPSLARRIEGINKGQLIEIGARPNTGKTSFHASLVMGADGFVDQGARVAVLLNEEMYHRVLIRYMTAQTNMNRQQIAANMSQAKSMWSSKRESILVKDSTGRNMDWVASLCKSYKPDIIIADMGDKFARKGSVNQREDQTLKDTVIQARAISKEYECAFLYMSQLSAEAEGKIILNQSMLEGSKTGKAAEADLMLLIAKDPPMSEFEDTENGVRHINVAKNKINGWHGVVTCQFDHETARYTA